MGNLYQFILCKFIQSKLPVQPLPDPASAGRLGVGWRDGLICGKRVCFRATLPSVPLISPGNGQMGYSGNHCFTPGNWGASIGH